MSRRRVIAGNWKMYKTLADTRAFFSAFKPLVADSHHCDIVVAPPFTALSTAVDATKGTKIAISGQNVSSSKEGAFTGEVAAFMLRDSGCTHVIVGHSERRQYYAESDEIVSRKTQAGLAAGLTVIPVWLPWMVLVTVSTAVTACVPTVFNEALNVCAPASPLTNV